MPDQSLSSHHHEPASPHPPHPPPTGTGGVGSDLAAALEPALLAACKGCLSSIQWFRSTWQSSGASTGYSTYTRPDGGVTPVVVKLPVGPSEFAWTTAADRVACSEDAGGGGAPHDHPTLRTYASGTSLGGYDLAWLVLERLPGPVLNHDLTEQTVLDLLRTASRWYRLASKVKPLEDPPPSPDWAALLDKARDAVHHSHGREATHAIAEPQRWNHAIKHVQRILPTLIARWAARPINAWCHGDLHPGNAMRRSPHVPTSPQPHPSSCPCVLLDLALVHPGHWIEDAIYLERLYWGKPEMLCGVKPISALSKYRKELGLHPAEGEDYPMLANIRRVLMAASVPAFLHREGHPRYVHHALEIIERLLPLVSK